MTRFDFQRLAKIRIKEAEALLDNGHYNGAYYLAGYAVECALKACIAKQTLRYDFPEKRRVDNSHTHDLTKLVRVADLEKEALRLYNAIVDPDNGVLSWLRKYW